MPTVDPSPAVYRQTLALRAVRDFLPDPIPDQVVDQILEAARWTGSSKNSQPWRFIVVRDPRQRQAVAAAGRFAGPLHRASLIIVLVRAPQGGDFDIGRVAQNIMLAAAGLGIASCPVTLHAEAKARAALDVPSDYGCRYAIALGYPDEAAHARSAADRPYAGRKPADQVISYERF